MSITAKINQSELEKIIIVKRLFEYLQGNDEVVYSNDSIEIISDSIKHYGMSIPLDVLSELVSYYKGNIKKDEPNKSFWLKSWEKWQSLLQDGVNQIRESKLLEPSCLVYTTWRNLQIARNYSELGNNADALFYGLAAFELTDGCTGRCPYCGLSAGKLKDVFLYTPENRALWREILDALQIRFGAFSVNSVCYWATDPYDNPDYTKFIADFKDVLGTLPQTTSSLPTSDISWLKKLLALYEDSKITCRVSVNSPELLEKLHNNFTPKELYRTQLLINYSNRFPVVRSGRLFDKSIVKTKSPIIGTIACITGYIVNMCRKNVKFVSPCAASKRWPYGYIVHHEASFETADDFVRIIDHTIMNNMKTAYYGKDLISFRNDLEVNCSDDALIFRSLYCEHSFRGSKALEQLVHILKDGQLSFEDMLSHLMGKGIGYLDIVHNINELRTAGLLSEQVELQQI